MNYGGGEFGGPATQQRIMVKRGRIVYCAAFGDLLEYQVGYFTIGPNDIDDYKDTGQEWDDESDYGRPGQVKFVDEVANDGVPSRIEVVDDEYLGPFAIIYKEAIEKALRLVKFDHNGKERVNWPLEFYGISVAQVPIYSDQLLEIDRAQAAGADREELEGLLPEGKVPRYAFLQQQLESQVTDLEERLLERFLRPDGSEYDTKKYRKNVDITRLESSLEFATETQGMGGGGGFGGGGFGGGAMGGGRPGPVGVGNIALDRARNLPGAEGGTP